MADKDPPYGQRAFSLVEVVLALGIFAFAVLSIVGLFVVGIRSSRDSEDGLQAASTAQLLAEMRRASPTSALPDFAISTNALTQPYGPAFSGGSTNYISIDGNLTNKSSATYRIVCLSGTNIDTGPDYSQLYILLSWPPQADVNAGAANQYEIITQIPNH